MPSDRRRCLLAAALAACALALTAGPAMALDEAGTRDPDALAVFADYADDCVLDADYPPDLLRASLAAVNGDPSYRGFADAVSQALDRRYLGLPVSPAPPVGSDPGRGLLGRLPPIQRGQGPPAVFWALSTAGGILLIAGALCSLIRRMRSRKQA